MSSERTVTDRYVTPAPDDIVSFSVVGAPKKLGVTVDELLDRLKLETLAEYKAPQGTLTHLKQQLKSLGFEVFGLQSPVVSARGTVDRFQKVFACTLAKRTRTTGKGDATDISEAVVLAPGSPKPSAERLEGALLIAIVEPMEFFVPAIPGATNTFHLRLPGDIAQLTGASATHRQTTPQGESATGAGVRVAVIDRGFALHPYFDQHAYNITRLAASDTSSPEVDAGPHGTPVIAALLACAPDVEAFGIKAGVDPVLAFNLAMACPGLRAICVSWGDNLRGAKTLPERLVPLWIRILDTIGAGVAVIAAAGNGHVSFPAMMPEVIAVGGAAVDDHDTLQAWDGGSSFSSAIFLGRDVPDLCAFASDMCVPVPAAQNFWDSNDGTSLAAPQVCGIAALLLQKNPALGPEDIRVALMSTATDITAGTTASKDAAVVGRDRATGAGLVNARQAWQVV